MSKRYYTRKIGVNGLPKAPTKITDEDVIKMQASVDELAINTLSPLMKVYRERDNIETAEIWGYSEEKPNDKGWKKVSFWYRESK